MHLIAREAIDSGIWPSHSDGNAYELLNNALMGVTVDNIEGVEIIGHPFNHDVQDDPGFRCFYRNPVTKILEIRPMSSVNPMSPFAHCRNEASVIYLYVHASMLIALDPVDSRKELVI
ncbi:hypothetical protein J3R83DRAFT_10521 [Lanmaoa asiatica]|nr:hypothetical protein J3R83DRAFT_10521 [Lanmaoa asiatica]